MGGGCGAAGEKLEGDAGTVREVGAGIEIVGHGVGVGGVPAVSAGILPLAGLIIEPLAGGAVIGGGSGGAQGGVAAVDKGAAEGGLVFQRATPVQPRFIGHEVPLAAAGGVKGAEIGLIALGEALLVQTGRILGVVSQHAHKIAAHEAHLGVAPIGEDDLVPVPAGGVLLGGDDADVVPFVEHDAAAAELHRGVLRTGAGADVHLVQIDVGLRAGAGQNGCDQTHQHQRQQQRREKTLGNIRFCR